MNIQIKLPSLREYSRDARLLLAVSGLTAVSFYGIQMLLRSLYLLRLGFDTAYLGTYLGTGALAYMGMGIPSGIAGQLVWHAQGHADRRNHQPGRDDHAAH